MKISHNNFLKLSFDLAKINLGKTNSNPSVGCVVVKNGVVISSGYTSLNGRPHAEHNALNKKIDFKNADIYVTMEPCTHYGKTPPCINLILKKKIKRVFFSSYDADERTSKKIFSKLSHKKIKIFKKEIKEFKNFYQSYFINKYNNIPHLDGKIAISKDFYTINKRSKWITNELSRKRAHLIRSEYDSIISTSKSINLDNSILNCRLKGFDRDKPNLIIIDLNLRIKKNLDLFKNLKKRKILIVTFKKNQKKINYFIKKGIKVMFVSSLKTKENFLLLFKRLKQLGYNRILVESGLVFLNELMKNKLIHNLYIFQSSKKLGKRGKNNDSNKALRDLKKIKNISVNLDGDKLYKLKLKNV